MDEELFKQALAEVIHSTEGAIALLAQAIARRANAQQMADDLRALLDAGKLTGEVNGLTERIARNALAALDAEAALQARDRGIH